MYNIHPKAHKNNIRMWRKSIFTFAMRLLQGYIILQHFYFAR